MAFQIVGQPGVSAFLKSLLLDLDAVVNMSDDLFMDVNSELKKMVKMLLKIQDVLVDAERKRLVEKSVDLWMDELKDLFYDIDDLVDEIKMEKQHLQQASTGQPSNGTQVCSNFSDVYCTSNIINSRLFEVSNRVDELAQEAVCLELKRDAGQYNANCVASQAMVRPKTGSCADESEMHGREKDIDNIIDMLLVEDGGRSRKNYEVVCIVGMGGLGKTTLAQLVFEDHRVKNYFTVKSWACVSDVFDLTKVMKELIECFEENDGKSHKQSPGALQNSLKSIINGKKFLLVLDDVWTAKEWDKLKAPFNSGAKGSKILVTTRQVEVAKAVCNNAPYCLRPLEDEQCLAIFNDNAFGDIDGSDEDADLIKLGEEIARKCGGVPLVAKVIGAMLRGEEEGKWKAVKENDLWNLAYEDEDLHPGLRLSYFYLPPFLKRCFEYFALFPSDFKFYKDELVRMWMAEGLIELKEGTEPEEIGSQYYNDLKGRSLIQENNRMHDMVHHLACIVSWRFFFQRNSGSCSSTSSLQSVRHAFIKDKPELLIDAHKLRTLIHKGDLCQEVFSYKMLRVLELKSVLDLPSSIGCDMKHLRYLSSRGGIGNSGFLDSICTLTKLQVLDIPHCSNLQNLPLNIGKLSNLRYLRLTKARMTTLPDSVCSLSNLRVLDLSECRCLTTLPNSICTLSNLEVLNLSWCSKLSILPESVCNLVNLRVLDLDDCECLITLPIDIGNLQQLQKLVITTKVRLPESIVNATNLHDVDIWRTNQPAHLGKMTKLQNLERYRVGKEKGQGIDELKDMNRLKGSLSIWNMENIANVEEASMADLKSKKHIDVLKFKWEDSNDKSYRGRDGEMEVRILDVLEPHVALKHLTFLHYIGPKFPSWMSSTGFHNLTQLHVRDLPMIRKMEGMVFQSLKVLLVKNCPSLGEISMTSPMLEKLTLVKCKELKLILLPRLWDTLITLECDYSNLDHCLQQLKATNALPYTKLEQLIVSVSVGVDDEITILPVGVQDILTSLEMLRLQDLPPTNFKIVSEENQKLLKSISQLSIVNCPHLVSLESLQLPLSLKRLYISDCPNLRNLPSGLRHTSSLQHIAIYDCPNLELGPHDLLPPSVSYKVIWQCPKLKEQLEREDRADWK